MLTGAQTSTDLVVYTRIYEISVRSPLIRGSVSFTQHNRSEALNDVLQRLLLDYQMLISLLPYHYLAKSTRGNASFAKHLFI